MLRGPFWPAWPTCGQILPAHHYEYSLLWMGGQNKPAHPYDIHARRCWHYNGNNYNVTLSLQPNETYLIKNNALSLRTSLLIDWLCGTHFTYLLVGYVCHMADVYWGPSGRRYHRTVSHLAWANSHRPPEDKACWASLSRGKTDMCSVSGEVHPCLGLLPVRYVKQSYPLTCLWAVRNLLSKIWVT